MQQNKQINKVVDASHENAHIIKRLLDVKKQDHMRLNFTTAIDRGERTFCGTKQPKLCLSNFFSLLKGRREQLTLSIN